MGKKELEREDEALLGDEERVRRVRIRCPKCQWKPGSHDRWWCRCGTTWNTFDTRGVCPGCGFVWKVTQCLACQLFSAHDHWYAID